MDQSSKGSARSVAAQEVDYIRSNPQSPITQTRPRAAACGLASGAKPQAARRPGQRPTLPMKAPPVKPGNARKLARGDSVSASKMMTLDDSTGPGTVAISSRPSRLVSTDAT